MKRNGSVQLREKGHHLLLRNGWLTVDYDLEDGSWGITLSKGGSFRGMRFFGRVQVNGEWVETRGHRVERWEKEDVVDALGEGTRVELLHQAGDEPLELKLIVCVYRERPSLLLGLSIRNRTEETLRIGEARPIEIDTSRGGSLYLGEGLDTARIYRESNNICASVVRGLRDAGMDGQESREHTEEEDRSEYLHQSGWVGLIFNPQSRTVFLGGFVTVETALGKIVTRYRPAQGITQWYAACKYDGLAVKPGGELMSETCYLDVRSDPFESLETFADVVVAENNLPPKQETPALWCSWYPYRLKLTEEEVLNNARVIAERFRDYGVKVLQLDYGWNDKDTPGEWSHNEERFPHGLTWLVERLRSMGLELGLWVAPFIVFEGSAFFRDHPDCVIMDAEGRPSA
ncbi:MAG: alpha-galactosidase, partial [Candidatus Latescibacteria bacterium]|nr:alpha-galactosidase [Candidatus Latescibacterota bacterium]